MSSAGYCWYDNDSVSNDSLYGILYNWYAIADSRKLAPSGWHIPSDDEWTELENYCIANGYNWDNSTTVNRIGKSLAAKIGWEESETEGDVGFYLSTNNKTEFTAFPSGSRLGNGDFLNLGKYTEWWSATEESANYIYVRLLSYTYQWTNRISEGKNTGNSVRCIRDN